MSEQRGKFTPYRNRNYRPANNNRPFHRSNFRPAANRPTRTGFDAGPGLKPPSDNTVSGSTGLFNIMCERENLLVAWREIRKGRGASARRWSGAADRVSLDLFERQLDRQLTRLRYQLLNGSYRPDPVVNFRLPKPGGGHRVLAVLTVRDRVAQRSALNLIVPLFEPEFLECSYGFRPDRSTSDALAEIERAGKEGYRWAVDADIEAFFDNIDRGRLVRLLREKIRDQAMLTLLKLWLNNSRQINREPLETGEPPKKPEKSIERTGGKWPETTEGGNLTGRLADFTRLALEGGLDWGISTLSGQPQVYGNTGYGYRSQLPYGRFNDDDEEDRWRSAAPEPNRTSPGRETVKKLGMEGALAGLWLAKGYLRQGGSVGKVARVSAAVGAAGMAGVAAHRLWQNFNRQETQAKPTENLEKESWPVPERRRGIAQGSVLSPLYSNIYLHEFDLRITRQGYRLVRFADDLVILCRTGREAEEALAFAEQVLGGLGLAFKPAKTTIRPLGKGFKFLGAEMADDRTWKVMPEANPRQNGLAAWATKTGAGWLKKEKGPGVVQGGRGESREMVKIKQETAEAEITEED